ncbi:hypothetical protein [Methylobacterium gnaphalii]|nr:hypothetical protein [Methylobacterium gnaphalii]GJD67776.1 hypothetical protein MMMDOFMJ_0693 [Methylobacterium gnaphalii]
MDVSSPTDPPGRDAEAGFLFWLLPLAGTAHRFPEPFGRAGFRGAILIHVMDGRDGREQNSWVAVRRHGPRWSGFPISAYDGPRSMPAGVTPDPESQPFDLGPLAIMLAGFFV